MATATVPDRRRLLEERWRVLMLRPVRFAGEARISADNSKRYLRIQETLEELATLLVDEVGDDDLDGLRQVTEQIWEHIESSLIDWAASLEAEEAAFRSGGPDAIATSGGAR
jgi:hypothetical protein